MNCLESKPKLIYHNDAPLIVLPESYTQLIDLCFAHFPHILPGFVVFGISATGRRQLCEENFREVMNGSAKVKSFEVFDSSESDGVNIRPFCLVGFQCLHETAFMMQSYSLEDFKLQSRCIKVTRGFSYVVTSDSLVVSGGMKDFLQKAIRYRNGFMEPLPDLLNPHSFHLSLSDDLNYLYIIGGKDKRDNPACKCELFDFSLAQWTPLPNLPRKVMTVTGCLLSGRVFILISGVVHRLDSNAWTPVLTLDPKFSDFPVVPVSNVEMLVYGSRKDCETVVLHADNLTTRQVQQVPAVGKLHYFKPARHRGRVYMYAGQVNTVITYNVSEGHWHFVSEEYWEMRKWFFFVCSLGRRGGVSWQVWKLPQNLIREIAGEFLGAPGRSPR